MSRLTIKKMSVEEQHEQFVEEIKTLKKEIETLSFKNDELITENKTLSIDNEVLSTENETLLKDNEKLRNIILNFAFQTTGLTKVLQERLENIS